MDSATLFHEFNLQPSTIIRDFDYLMNWQDDVVVH